MEQKKNTNYFLPTTILFSLLTAATFAYAAWYSSAQTRALDALTPILKPLAETFRQQSGYGHPWFLYIALIVIASLALISVRLESRNARTLCYSGMLAVAAQCFLVDREMCFWIAQRFGLAHPGQFFPGSREDLSIALPAGIGLYAAAIVVFLVGYRKNEATQIFDLGAKEGGRFGIREAAILTLVFIIALVFRTYALNLLPDSFEGELSPFSAGATSFEGLFVANRGSFGPWAPLGILYYLPIYITTKAFGTTLLALRLSSALVGVLTLPLIYLLAARLGGRIAGLLASALFALECLHLGWSRTDIHPHGVTTWPTLLMCWFLLKAFDTRKLSWACGVAFMMGVSWHQYPSGQSAVAIPLLALGIFWITNRCKLPLKASQIALVSAGIVLWVIGLPLSYYLADGVWRFTNPFTLTGPRAAWGEDNLPTSGFGVALLVLTKALRQLGDVLQGIFYRQPYIFHQEWISYADFVNGRTVAWLEVPFVVLGFLILLCSVKRFESAVVLGWVMAAILPGILSEHAYPKRLSTFFPALDIIAALSLAAIAAALPVGRALWKRCVATSTLLFIFVCYTAYTSYTWFSGRFWRYGEPVEISFAAKLSEAITPGTIVISDLNRSYEAGKYLYLVLDHLAAPESRPNLWYSAGTPMVSSLVAEPRNAAKLIATSIPYTWTKLREQLPETLQFKDWSKVVFVIQSGPEDREANLSNLEAASTRCNNPKITRLERQRSALNTLVVIECALSDMK
jgi:hypothetical protein